MSTITRHGMAARYSEASVFNGVIYLAGMVPEGVSDAALAELFITATVTRGQGEGVTVTKTDHHKCGRCWRHLPEVAEDGSLCNRCETVLDER